MGKTKEILGNMGPQPILLRCQCMRFGHIPTYFAGGRSHVTLVLARTCCLEMVSVLKGRDGGKVYSFIDPELKKDPRELFMGGNYRHIPET